MAEIVRSASESVFVRSSPVDRLTVWYLRDFLQALDEAGVADDTPVQAQRSDVGHLTGLSVRETYEREPRGTA